MAAIPSSTTTAIAWSIQIIALGNLSFPIARLSFQLYGRTTLPARQVTSVDCWLDTGAPLTVIPFYVHNQRLLWHPLPGLTTTWMGQRCDLGRVWTFGCQRTSLLMFVVPYRCWPSSPAAIRPARLCRSCSGWNFS